jgi:hypothetical protein
LSQHLFLLLFSPSHCPASTPSSHKLYFQIQYVAVIPLPTSS